MDLKKAFTYSEVIITLTIIGIIAALSVPSIIHNQNKKVNKTKLKKAVEIYDNFINQVLIYERITRTANALDEWGSEVASCGNQLKYFKVVKSTSNPCKFKTADGIWWDVTRPSKVMVAFKSADLIRANADPQTNYRAFWLVTSFDADKRARIIDNNYGTIKGDYSLLVNSAKVRAFIDNKSIISYFKYCADGVCAANGCSPGYGSCIRKMSAKNGDAQLYDENGKLVASVLTCEGGSNQVMVDCSTYRIYPPDYNRWDYNSSNCSYSNQGDTFASCKFTTKADENGNYEQFKNGCNDVNSLKGCKTHVIVTKTVENGTTTTTTKTCKYNYSTNTDSSCTTKVEWS